MVILTNSPFIPLLKKLHYDKNKDLKKKLLKFSKEIEKLRKERFKLNEIISTYHKSVDALNSDIVGLRLELNHDQLINGDKYDGEFQRESTLQNRNIVEYKFRMEDAFSELIEYESERRKLNNTLSRKLSSIENESPNSPNSFKKDINKIVANYKTEIKNCVDYITTEAIGMTDEESSIELTKMIDELNTSGKRNISFDSAFYVAD